MHTSGLSGKSMPKTDLGLAQNKFSENGPSAKAPFPNLILRAKKGGRTNPSYFERNVVCPTPSRITKKHI